MLTKNFFLKIRFNSPSRHLHCRKENNYVEIISGNFQSKFHYVWLRDNCLNCLSSSDQKIHRSGDIINVKPMKITCDSEKVSIIWNDNHMSEYTLEWLKKYAYDNDSISNVVRKQRSTVFPWCSKTIPGGTVPVLQYKDIISNDKDFDYVALFQWISNLRVYGVCKIENIPCPEDTFESSTFERISSRLGAIRETMYGKIFHVVAVENPNNMAYTNMPLPYHQDLCYYDDIPGVQLLHCVKNDVAGGENGFVDGFNVCQKLKQIYPEAFETLAKTRITFQKIDNTDHRVKYFPLIGLDENGEVKELRHSPPWEGPLMAPFDEVENFYSAYRKFTDIADDPENAIKVRNNPGDLYSFDNARVLHNRFPILESGKRHIQGCYVSKEDLLSTFYSLERKLPK